MEIKGYRKAGRMGNSLGIEIPKEIAEKLNIKAGDDFEVTANTETGEITIRHVKKIPLAGGLTPEMEKELEDIFKRYENTFKNLKDR
ncbi:antitoxin MazE [Thermoflavimicrobium dichotomicum]|uniref:Antitoxin MazE n=2 Tax=Thermoflavimicrobium dichotomicum TaxID=46223 RepID=A0A1I3RDB9_9BACL|nr:antitoxin MazE [Thermoflavimicrobium dichotomicum]